MQWNKFSPKPRRLKKRNKRPDLPAGLAEAWSDPDKTKADICIEFGLQLSEIKRIAELHNLGDRPPVTARARSNNQAKPLPTPEEIAELTAQIRANWSDEDHASRFMGPIREDYYAPHYHTTDIL